MAGTNYFQNFLHFSITLTFVCSNSSRFANLNCSRPQPRPCLLQRASSDRSGHHRGGADHDGIRGARIDNDVIDRGYCFFPMLSPKYMHARVTLIWRYGVPEYQSVPRAPLPCTDARLIFQGAVNYTPDLSCALML